MGRLFLLRNDGAGCAFLPSFGYAAYLVAGQEAADMGGTPKRRRSICCQIAVKLKARALGDLHLDAGPVILPLSPGWSLTWAGPGVLQHRRGFFFDGPSVSRTQRGVNR